MNKFILGMVVAAAAFLLWIYRKKIFIAAQDDNQNTNGNELITSKTAKSSLVAMPGTEAAKIGSMIKEYLSKSYDTAGTQDDSMLDSKISGNNPSFTASKIQTMDIG